VVAGGSVLNTAAGSLRAVLIRYAGWATRHVSGTLVQQRVNVEVWYAPSLRRVARFRSDVNRGSSGVYVNTASRESAELVAIRRE